MRTKNRGPKRNSDSTAVDADTLSQKQPQTNAERPNQPQERMPHERDESATATGNRMDEEVPPSSRVITDAHKNVEEGQVDTDRRGIPNDVPSTRRR